MVVNSKTTFFVTVVLGVLVTTIYHTAPREEKMSHGKGMQIRAGNRGGRDQFDWEDVKVDKYRENYLGKQVTLKFYIVYLSKSLGHSLKASVGRWQKGKDLSW